MRNLPFADIGGGKEQRRTGAGHDGFAGRSSGATLGELRHHSVREYRCTRLARARRHDAREALRLGGGRELRCCAADAARR